MALDAILFVAGLITGPAGPLAAALSKLAPGVALAVKQGIAGLIKKGESAAAQAITKLVVEKTLDTGNKEFFLAKGESVGVNHMKKFYAAMTDRKSDFQLTADEAAKFKQIAADKAKREKNKEIAAIASWAENPEQVLGLGLSGLKSI